MDGSFEGRGPDCQLAVVADGGSDEVGERAGIEFATFGYIGVAANFAREVVFGLAMLDKGQNGIGFVKEWIRTLDSQIERGRMWRFIR